MHSGYRAIFRRIKRSPDFQDGIDRLIFEDLLLDAAWVDREVKVGGLSMVEPEGSVFVTRKTLRDHLGDWCHLDPTTILRRLAKMETRGCVKLTSSPAGTLVEFIRWEDYQARWKAARTPQPTNLQAKEEQKEADARRAARAQGTAQVAHPCADSEVAHPPAVGGGPNEGSKTAARAQGTAQVAHPCADSEVAQHTLRKSKKNTTKLIHNTGPGPVCARAREEQKSDQTGPEEGGLEEEALFVRREIAKIAEEWGATGVNMRKAQAKEMVRAALAGEYPCERQPDWRPRRAYTPAEIIEAARWFYADRCRDRIYASEAERRRFLQLNWLLGVNKCTGADALAEALGKARRYRRRVSTTTPGEAAREERLDGLFRRRRQRLKEVLQDLGLSCIPADPDERARLLGGPLRTDEEYRRLEVLSYVLRQEMEGEGDSEDVREFVADFVEQFGYDPRTETPQKATPDTTRELELREELENAELERDLRKTRLLDGIKLPDDLHARSVALGERLHADEAWSLWHFRVTALEIELGRGNFEDVDEPAAWFAERFGYDPRKEEDG